MFDRLTVLGGMLAVFAGSALALARVLGGF